MKWFIISVLLLSASLATADTNTYYDLSSKGNWGITNWGSFKVTATRIYFNGTEFGETNGVIYIDTHGKPMNEAASNILNSVIELFKENGYKLVK